MTKILSFHSNPAIKDEYIKRLEAHYKADDIIKGKYWGNGKGCAVGCTIHSGRHDDYPKLLGISWRLALVEDSLFEKLPNDQAKEFPLQFLRAIPVGKDTEIAFKQFVIWNLTDKKEGLVHVVKDEKVKKALQEISDTYELSFTKEITVEHWKKLAYAYASKGWKEIFEKRILRMRDKLLELLKAL